MVIDTFTRRPSPYISLGSISDAEWGYLLSHHYPQAQIKYEQTINEKENNNAETNFKNTK
jgi:inorganic triphosphatase YgiF